MRISFQAVVLGFIISLYSYAPPFFVPEYLQPHLAASLYLLPEERGQLLGAHRIIREELNRNISAPGKRVRPLLIYLAAGLLGLSPTEAREIARIAEFTHTASLVHDDVLDGDATRRGVPTSSALFGTKRAVLFGDYMLAELTQYALKALPEKARAQMLDELMTVIKGMAVGEQIQAMAIEKEKYSFDDYQDIIRQKTGVLFQWAMEGPTYLLRGNQRKIRNHLGTFALALGELYQRWDDLDSDDYRKKEVNLVRFYAGETLGVSPISGKLDEADLLRARERAVQEVQALAKKIRGELLAVLIEDTKRFATSRHYQSRRLQCIRTLNGIVDYLGTPPAIKPIVPN